MAEYENTFVREVKEKNITEPDDILNWYRNLYHTEDNHTEHGIMAYAINDYFNDVVPKSEVEALKEMLDATIAGQETLQKALAEKTSEVEYWKKQCFHACMNNGCLDPNIITRSFEIAEGHNDPRGEDGPEGEDGQGDLNPLYRMQKAEIAREIFEEFDNIL